MKPQIIATIELDIAPREKGVVVWDGFKLLVIDQLGRAEDPGLPASSLDEAVERAGMAWSSGVWNLEWVYE